MDKGIVKGAGVLLMLLPLAYCGRQGSFGDGIAGWSGEVFLVLMVAGFVVGGALLAMSQEDDKG